MVDIQQVDQFKEINIKQAHKSYECNCQYRPKYKRKHKEQCYPMLSLVYAIDAFGLNQTWPLHIQSHKASHGCCYMSTSFSGGKAKA